jgi:HK97 gp10 family phage protein
MTNSRVNVRFNEHNVERDLRKKAESFLAGLMMAIQGHAKRLVPVDTGLLKASIKVEPKMPASKMKVIADTNYAAFVEYGTYKQKAQPYMRPARDIALNYDVKSLNHRLGTNFKVKK